MVNQILPLYLPGYDLTGFQDIYSEDAKSVVDRLLTVIDG